MIQAASFASTTAAPPRPDAPTPANPAAAREGAAAAARTPGDPAPRQAHVAAAARACRQETADAATAGEPPGDAFASLLLPATDAPPSPALPASATPPAMAEPAAASTPDQWLAMLAGALAVPVAINPAEAATATPAGIPAQAAATAPSLPLVAATASPTTAPLATAPLAPLPPMLEATLEAALPAADASAGGSDAKPAFESLLGGLTGAPPPSATAAFREVAPPPAPLQMPSDPAAGFDDGIGTHIAWMAGQRLGEARIQVHPEHLGPVEITLKLDDARVDAQFHSTHVEVRAALEASVPRLREMLAQHGLQLGQADVGQRQAGSHAAGSPAPQSGGGDGESVGTSQPAPLVHRRGLLDEYA